MYVLQVSAIWIVLYAVYFLLYRKLTFFNNNRAYLLLSLVLGLSIPIIAPMMEIHKPPAFDLVDNWQQVDVSTAISTAVMPMLWTDIALRILAYVYISVVLFMLSRYVYGLLSIYRMYRSGDRVERDGMTFIYNDKVHLPFSFFKMIFISRGISFGTKLSKVVAHEITHVKHWHTIDVLLVELLHAFFWFNPILIFYRHSLKESHEFIADRHVVTENKKDYIDLLLQAMRSDFELHLTNSFFNSQIFNRITMLNSQKSSRLSTFRYVLMLPLLGLFTYLFASSKIDAVVQFTNDIVVVASDTMPAPPPPPEPPAFWQKKGKSQVAGNVPPPPPPPPPPPAPKVEVTAVPPPPPPPPPPPAKRSKTKGDGVVTSSPADGNEKAIFISKDGSQAVSVKRDQKIGSNVLILVDGENAENVDDINPNDIEKVEVLKSAKTKYDPDGKYEGVILITTKKKAKQDQLNEAAKDNEFVKISAYPNPSTRSRVMINFTSSEKDQPINVEITDLQGNFRMKKTYTPSPSGEYEIDLQDAPYGTKEVIVRASQGKKYAATKVLMQE